MLVLLVSAIAVTLFTTLHATSAICRAPAATTRSFCELPPVEDVTLSSYLGTWYNAYASPNAHFVSKPGCSQARYTQLDNGDIGVLNCYFLPGEQKRPQCASGTARRGKSSGRLLVGFGGSGSGRYEIAALLGDASWGYSAAAVYSCSWRNGKPRELWWILVRDPYRPEEKLRQLRWKMWCKGYDAQHVVFEKTRHGSGCKYWYGPDGFDVQPPQSFQRKIRAVQRILGYTRWI